MESPPPPSEGSDFYATDSPLRNAGADAHTAAPAPDMDLTTGQDIANSTPQDGLQDEDEDDSSDMDTSSDSSRSPSPKPEPPSLPLSSPKPRQAGVKRRLDEVEESTNTASESADRASQRPRLSASPMPDTTLNGDAPPRQATGSVTPPVPTLNDGTRPSKPTKKGLRDVPSVLMIAPAGVIQQIFSELSPAGLARVVRVNRRFLTLLTDTRAQKSEGIAQTRDSDSLWKVARIKTYHNMPRPLPDKTEQQMFQLIGGDSCECCGALPTSPPPSTSPNDRGPGYGGVRVIWAFSVRLCGSCLLQNTVSVKSITLTIMTTLLINHVGSRTPSTRRRCSSPWTSAHLSHFRSPCLTWRSAPTTG
jgi:hypothetical protein